MPKTTVLHECHVRLGARIVDFHGWLLPVQYQGVLAEHTHCRTDAVVFDTSHMGLFLISGPDAATGLAGVGTQDAAAMRVGACKYGFLLNDAGGVTDDTILMRLDGDEFLLVVNAGTLDSDFAHLGEQLAGDVTLQNLSAERWGKFDLQGPKALDVLASFVDADVTELGYFTARRTRCCGCDCMIARTGYTGELGYEIMAPGGELKTIFEQIAIASPVLPAGLGARDSLRLEMGYPLYGNELSESHNPIEAGLGSFIDLSREFLGAAALRVVADAPPRRALVAMQTDTRRRAAEGDAIVAGGQVVGVVTSAAFSPSLQVSIAMGYVAPDAAMSGTELILRTARAELPATVCDKPLYTHGTCRTIARPQHP